MKLQNVKEYSWVIYNNKPYFVVCYNYQESKNDVNCRFHHIK